MSDSIEDIVKRYKENVFKENHPRSIGLFTIPEYPEFEANRGMWSVALDAILTTLRYLAPATLLTLFWGQQSFLFRILKHIDSAFRAIVFSSEEQKQAVLTWLASAGPVRVEHLDTVWRHGWVLCGVLDAALPGACAGHPPTRLSLKHAQAIADHYLGVEPVFSRQELESNDSLSRHQEWKLATYLDRIRQALSKLTPPVSKPVSQRTSPETTQFTLDYVAKGSGLTAAQVNNKAHFKIYPTAQQALDPGEITILIRGPRDTYGMTVLPPILGKAQMIRQKLLGLQSKQTFTENVLPITQGATYLRAYGKNDMNKTYYIPKTKYDIDIDVDTRKDHVKIGYVVNMEGKYLISITSRGQNIVGSPFTITASNNIISTLEKDNYCLEDGEEIDIVDVKTDRKVVLRIVDFVTEKMLLKENGTLEKISDDEAKILMATDTETDSLNFDSETYSDIESEKQTAMTSKKFNKVASKILAMNRVCRIFNDLVAEKQFTQLTKSDNFMRSRTKQEIPDIVNSTLTETNIKPYIIPELREKFIVPESISVSLRAEKSTYYDSEPNSSWTEIENVKINIPMESTRIDSPDSLDGYNVSNEDQEDNISDRMTPSGTNNPFLNEMFEENYVASKNLGPFVASEYERDNCQNEETRDSSITIVIDPNVTPSPNNNNPFIEVDDISLVKPDPIVFERPKTPVFKIISGEKVNREESVFIDPKSELIDEEALGNEFVNPFFMHHHQSATFEQPPPLTDFIIGAPVSLPPILRARSPEPQMRSLVLPGTEKCKKSKSSTNQEKKAEAVPEQLFSTPLHNNLNLPKDSKTENISSVSSTFHSLESNFTETIDNSNESTTSENPFDPFHSDSERNLTPRKDIWDSAYVSIDDNNSSPDNNNNENSTLCETISKQKVSPSDDHFGLKQEEITNMGPAEREIWQTCNELKSEPNKSQEDPKPHKWEIKRPTFTPIIEESDRSISSGTKDLSRTNLSTKQGETDNVSVAFAELNDMYQEYFPNSETGSIAVADEDNKLHCMEVEYVTQTKDVSVDSASEVSDVKRHEEGFEGTISEVQTNVTESISVSQPLRIENDQSLENNKGYKDETQFGETSRSNIVLEKKKYWDERIRQIEAKSAETSTLPKKKRISAKQLKHDSLSKRKGKQILKNFLNAGDYSQVKSISQVDDKETDTKVHEPAIRQISQDELGSNEKSQSTDEKLVERWKKYWDEKLETDQVEAEAIALKTKSPKINRITAHQSPSVISNQVNKVEVPVEIKVENYSYNNNEMSTIAEQQPVKQELPEEVFKAFETSPKRFFGTSRQQILNKIDTFLGKPAAVDVPSADVTGMCHESGLVSSRISLFHNMSNTEELPWARRKSQSMQNVSQKRDSDKHAVTFEELIKDTYKEVPKNKINETKNVNVTDAVNLKNKRARMIHSANQTMDETLYVPEEAITPPQSKEHVEMSVKEFSKEYVPSENKGEPLRKKSFSKSEMDIFNKIPDTSDDGLDKYKSCDELPKINVKSFISLYESVTKTATAPKPAKRVFRTGSADSQRHSQTNSITSDAVHRRGMDRGSVSNSESKTTTPGVTPTNLWTSKDSETVSNLSLDTRTSGSYDVDIVPCDNKETTYLSLSDIELEIVECSPDKSSESSPEREIEPAHIEYKNRFKLAKEFFQSIDELNEPRRPRKLNECEQLLQKQSTESLETERPQKRVKKNIKSHSMPSSEISKIWNQLQESQESSSNQKLVKISEKFNVEDLFTDVTEGKLSRQGSLRGIPHKKAVLEAFRSMENIADNTITSYEIAESQLTDFANEHTVKNAQTYLSEYPYLPTTDPSKYHSRLDVKASGLISLKELKQRKPRRNSVPDLRLNPTFTEDL
uniref:Calponin-homology (CH) domain-containing protein n=2 Tax=Heliothis virescens TaxID=7102 RepID=A0A2A4K3J4_HELVI